LKVATGIGPVGPPSGIEKDVPVPAERPTMAVLVVVAFANAFASGSSLTSVPISYWPPCA